MLMATTDLNFFFHAFCYLHFLLSGLFLVPCQYIKIFRMSSTLSSFFTIVGP